MDAVLISYFRCKSREKQCEWCGLGGFAKIDSRFITHRQQYSTHRNQIKWLVGHPGSDASVRSWAAPKSHSIDALILCYGVRSLAETANPPGRRVLLATSPIFPSGEFQRGEVFR